MLNTETRNPFIFKSSVYALLVIGSLVFCWPLVWMVGTSFKADKELFAGTTHFYPQRPVARQESPYPDARTFENLRGKPRPEVLTALETYVDTLPLAWPHNAERPIVVNQVARGIYSHMQDLLPKEDWDLPSNQLLEAGQKLIDAAMLTDLMHQIRHSLLIGQLRARSYDLQEDQLVSAADTVKAWKIEGDAQGHLEPAVEGKQVYGELHYNFKHGNTLRLTKTFSLSFPVDRLYRLQLSLRSDESWHPLKVLIEKQGSLYEAVKGMPMFDNNWSVITWQEPGPDDLTNKIRTWIHVEKVGSSPSYEHDPYKVKVTLEFGPVNAFSAWVSKIERNYLLVFDNMPFWRYTATSLLLVILNLIGTLFSCSVVAYSFARMRWPGRSMSYSMMLGTMMVPAQVTMIPFFLIIRWLNWYNTLYPLWVCSFFAGAFNVFLLHQFFMGIPTDLEDAAKIDGCGPLRIYWYIMLPLIKPAMATIAIFTFMGVWNDFMGPLIYLSDQRLYPLSLGLYALNVQAGASMSMMMAGSLLMILPVILIFFFAQRYFIEGITMTGLKS